MQEAIKSLTSELPFPGILLPEAMNQNYLPFSYSNETTQYIKEVVEKQKLKFIMTVPPGITSSSGRSTNLYIKIFIDPEENF